MLNNAKTLQKIQSILNIVHSKIIYFLDLVKFSPLTNQYYLQFKCLFLAGFVFLAPQTFATLITNSKIIPSLACQIQSTPVVCINAMVYGDSVLK